jgi:hypothetical protein
VVYGANDRAGQLGETGPPRPCLTQSGVFRRATAIARRVLSRRVCWDVEDLPTRRNRQRQCCCTTIHLVKRPPPLISQQMRGIIETGRSQSLYNESCDRSALTMPRTCCRIKGGVCFTNCVILYSLLLSMWHLHVTGSAPTVCSARIIPHRRAPGTRTTVEQRRSMVLLG